MSRTVFRSMGCDVVAEGATESALATFELYDAVFSRFRPGSELNRLNAAGGGLMSTLFAEALDVALWAARETGGLVDPTVGAAVLAAGYDRDFADGLDDPAPCGAAAPADHTRLHVVGRALVLPAGVRLDLNGVVKALAVDRAAEFLDGHGFVSAGGDLRTCDPVDVALPGGDVVRVTGGLATSGTSRRHWLRAGRRQHHLVDPRTGLPSSSRWSAVSVCASTCIGADVAAKAAFLLDEDGPDWLDGRGLPGRFVDEDGLVVCNERWRAAVPEALCT